MRERNRNRIVVPAGIVLLLLVSLPGCIAVSREITREAVTSGAAVDVTGRGHWEVEQEWQCQPAPEFDLERERSTFNGTSAAWLDHGWALSDFDVVTVPDEEGRPQRICLVGTFRRWIDA